MHDAYSTSLRINKHKQLEDFFDPQLRDTVIAFEFKFTMNEDANGSASSSFTLPFTNGQFGLNVGLGENKQRKNDRAFNVAEYFTDLVSDKRLIAGCHMNDEWRFDEEDWKYPVSGNIGLKEVIKTYTKLAGLQKFRTPDLNDPSTARASGNSSTRPPGTGRPDADDNADGDGGGGRNTSADRGAQRELDNFTDTLTFTTSYNGTVKPSLELSPVLKQFRLTEAAASFGGERKDVHKVGIIIKTKSSAENPLDVVQGILRERRGLIDLSNALAEQ